MGDQSVRPSLVVGRTRRRRKQADDEVREVITPEAIEAFKAGNWLRLHLALGLKPWECSPLEADTNILPANRDRSAWAASVERAKNLRKRLTS